MEILSHNVGLYHIVPYPNLFHMLYQYSNINSKNWIVQINKNLVPHCKLLLLNPAAISVGSLEVTLFWASRITREYVLL